MQLAVLFAFCLSLLPITGTLALPIAAGESGMSSSRFPLDRGELKNLTPSSGKKYLPVMPDSKLESRDFLRQDEVNTISKVKFLPVMPDPKLSSYSNTSPDSRLKTLPVMPVDKLESRSHPSSGKPETNLSDVRKNFKNRPSSGNDGKNLPVMPPDAGLTSRQLVSDRFSNQNKKTLPVVPDNKLES